jgi:hypothetical protein
MPVEHVKSGPRLRRHARGADQLDEKIGSAGDGHCGPGQRIRSGMNGSARGTVKQR